MRGEHFSVESWTAAAHSGMARGSLRAVVGGPVGLAGLPGQEEVATGGDGHIIALRAALDVGEGALIVGGAADACRVATLASPGEHANAKVELEFRNSKSKFKSRVANSKFRMPADASRFRQSWFLGRLLQGGLVEAAVRHSTCGDGRPGWGRILM